ncbi:MAG: hypothetical protein H6658_06285 [Ardenticatenaceae bacterium]|nr:hypothetical protein [Ardenticatenaceae bacterium]
MSPRLQNLFEGLGVYVLWAVLAAGMALVAFQIHATLIYFSLKVVQLPTFHALGWNTHTIHGLGRFLTLILGLLWLFLVTMLQGYLQDSVRERKIKARVIRMAFVLAGIYLLCVSLLFIFS